MAENIIESTVEDDGSRVKSLRVTIDQARLIEIQDILEKWGREKSKEFAWLNAFITHHLNKIDGLRSRAATLRASQSQEVTIWNAPQVGWVTIPVEQSSDPIITAHNEEIWKIDRAIWEFNADRSQFLATFISRYIAPPAPARNDPKPGERMTTQRVARQVGPNFTAPTWEAPTVSLRPEDNKDYMRTLMSKNVDDMTDDEIAILRGLYQKVWFKDVYEKFISASDNEREALKRMREAMKTANARDNSSWVNQWLIKIAQWLESKTPK